MLEKLLNMKLTVIVSKLSISLTAFQNWLRLGQKGVRLKKMMNILFILPDTGTLSASVDAISRTRMHSVVVRYDSVFDESYTKRVQKDNGEVSCDNCSKLLTWPSHFSEDGLKWERSHKESVNLHTSSYQDYSDRVLSLQKKNGT